MINFDPLFLPVKYECTNITDFKSNPYAYSLATTKSCGKQSNALDKSVRSAPNPHPPPPPPLSILFHYFLIITKRQC